MFVPSVDELVAILQRTALPTILVEGKEDMTAYRWIEDRFGLQKANILPCGGRQQLLDVYKRKNEFSSLSTAFLADQDMWLFTAAPCGFEQVVLTRGYSIENDILDSSHVHKLLSHQERVSFDTLADILSVWFAFEIEQCRAGLPWSVNIHPNYLIPLRASSLNHAALQSRIFKQPKGQLSKSIRANFGLRFRGKSLLELWGYAHVSSGHYMLYVT